MSPAQPAPRRTQKTRAQKMDKDLIPRPSAGTLLIGPYLVGAGRDSVRIRWEVMGEREGAVVLADGTGKEVRESGTLLTADPETIHLPGRIYEVEFFELQPCTTYSYRLIPFEARGSLHTFRTAPPQGGSCPEGVRIMVYGDSRTNHKIHASLMPSLEQTQPHLLVNVGDIVHTARRVYEWHKFFEIERRLLSSAPLAIVPGNHEGYKDKKFGSAMMDRYFRAGRHGGSGHYSFDYGPIHFTMLDLYWGEALNKSGGTWLQKDLAAVRKGQYKFVILHEPVYSFGHHVPKAHLTALRAVFSEHGVHAVCAGHSHIYEHFLADGTHYLTLGGTGAPFHEPRENPVASEEPYLVKTGKFHNFLLVNVTAEGLTFEIIDSDRDMTVEKWVVPVPSVQADGH